MPAGVCLRPAQIEHHPATALGLEVLRLQHPHLARRGQRPHATFRVHLLHVAEVGRARNPLVQLALHELFPGPHEHRVVVALQADRRVVAFRDVAAADRARAVRGQQDGLVAQRQEFRVHCVVELAGVLGRLERVRQVGPPGFADEQRVAGEHPHARSGESSR